MRHRALQHASCPVRHARGRALRPRFLLPLTLAATLAGARAATLEVDVTDFLLRPLPEREITLTPLPYPGGATLTSIEPVRQRTDTNGFCAFTNLLAGLYRVDIQGTPMTSFRVAVPSATGVVNAASALLAPTNIVSVEGLGYSAGASDLRYPSAFGSNLVSWTRNGLRWLDVSTAGPSTTNTALYGSVWSLNNEWRWLRDGVGSLRWQWSEEPEMWQDALILDEVTVRFPYVPIANTDDYESPERLTTQSRATNVVVALTSNGVPQIKAHFGDIATNRNTIMVIQGDSLSNDYNDWATEHILTNGGWLARCWRTNFAIGGQTAAAMSNLFNTTIGTVAPRRQDEGWLFLWGGINDLAGGANATNVYGYLTNIWQRARDAKFKVVAFTLMHATTISDSAQQQRTNLNALIEGNPALYDYLVRAHLVLTNAADSTYFADGIHPNALGSSLIAREVVNVLGREEPALLVARAGTLGSKRDLVLKPSGGRVGIGRLDPAAELDVNGAGVVRGALSVTNGLILGSYTADGMYPYGGNRIVFNRPDYGKTNRSVSITWIRRMTG